MSANGMVSNKRNMPDWLSPEYEKGFWEICQRTKAVIMGKTTYNILAPDHLPLKEEGKLLVWTHDTLVPAPQKNITFTDFEPAGMVQLLESEGFTEAVIIGGAATTSAFIKAGHAHELVLVVEPRLFGGGLNLVEGIEEVTMALEDVERLGEHTVQLRYRLLYE
jgi:Dihydrofolate reductase